VSLLIRKQVITDMSVSQ